MYTVYHTHSVLNSTEQLRSLADAWNKNNKLRVYFESKSDTVVQSNTIPVSTNVNSIHPTTLPRVIRSLHTRSNPYAVASMKQVLASRKDLLSTTEPLIVKTLPDNTYSMSSTDVREGTLSSKKCIIDMAQIESQILTILTNTFFSTTPPYSNSDSTPLSHQRNMTQLKKNVVPRGCFACITQGNPKVSRQVYLPITTPSQEQLSICQKDPSYNKNVIVNIAEALSRNGIQTVMTTGVPNSCKKGLLYIDVSLPVEKLGTTECCEGLLFGNNRRTSSPEFCVGSGIGAAYASAVHLYQTYSNVAIGTQITLVPSTSKGAMQAMSMTCPELNLSHTVTRVSHMRTHPKFGPSHTACIVDIMKEVTSFAKTCSETYMSIPSETLHDIQEDSAMPAVTSSKIDHCFAHSAPHGIGAYVGTHSIVIPTGFLNTYTTSSAFPLAKDLTIHVACIYGCNASVCNNALSTTDGMVLANQSEQ